MHAHVRRNLGFDSTFGGLGVLTSVVWQYTFHFESLHFRFLWSLPPVGHGLWLVPAAVWRLDQAALWNMTLHCTHSSSHSHPAVALLQGIAIGTSLPYVSVCFACLCLLWCLDPFGIFFYFWQNRQNKDHWVALWPSLWWWIWWGNDGKNHREKWRWLKLKLKVITNSIKIW